MSVLKISGLGASRRLVHGFSSKLGGASAGRYKSLNMSFNVGDDARLVERNRNRFLAFEGIDLSQVVCPRQIHSADIAIVTSEDCGRGAFSYSEGIEGVDGLITQDLGVCLMVMAADCTPITFFDPENLAVGLVHAGRAGTTNDIVDRTVGTMVTAFGSRPDRLVVGIGPTICGDHYPLTEAKAAQVRMSSVRTALFAGTDGLPRFDLTQAHTTALERAGVQSRNVHVSGLCTFENEQLLFSERRDGAPTGRFAAIAMLK